MSWSPLRAIPDPIDVGLCDAVRAAITSLDTYSGVERAADGSLLVTLADSRRLRVNLTFGEPVRTNFGVRDAMRYELTGRAILGAEGFGIAGHAILDLKTRAFLQVVCQIQWRDRANGRPER